MAAAERAGGPDGINILVVDDRPAKLLAMEALLADLGATVICAASGVEALRQLLERDFAVVLLDVNMPDMDGFETAALIRRRPRSQHVPIIFMTAGSDEAHALQGYSLGAVDYVLTPVVPEVLRTKVSVFVELSRMAAQLQQQAEHRIALVEERAARAAAEEAGRRMALLAEAGQQLTHSLDLDATLDAFLSVLVPTLADVAVLRLSLRGRTLELTRGLEAAGPDADPAVLALMEEAGRTASTHLLRDGRAGADAAGIACPVVAHGTVHGVLAVLRHGGRAAYDADGVVLIEDLCSRAAIAIDNSLLYQEIEQRDARKDQFVAMLAHELRNPLGAISSAMGVLDMLAVGPDAVAQARSVIKRQVGSLTQLIDDLLDVARVTAGKIALVRSVVDLSTAAIRCIQHFEPIAQASGQTITVSGEPAWIDADSTRLEQIISNLIGNALKYTNRGGTVAVRVAPADDEAVLEVEDSGIGMTPEVLARAFDLFFQADPTPDRAQGGLGVGLTLVRQLVELHGGRVEAASPGRGHGSRFTVRFPLRTPLPERPTTAAPRPEAVPCRIVVIEDNEDAREMLRMLLELEGHEVRTAEDGLRGIEVTQAAEPDIVFVDVGLPGLDGYEVARRLRERRQDAFLVALTGYGQPEDRRRALEAGFDAHVVKPIEPARLAGVIASAQRARKGAGEARPT